MTKCKVSRETKGMFASYWCKNFPADRYYIVRRLSDGKKMSWVHHFPTADYTLPKGYPSKRAADKHFNEWYRGQDAKVVSGVQARKYLVPRLI